MNQRKLFGALYLDQRRDSNDDASALINTENSKSEQSHWWFITSRLAESKLSDFTRGEIQPTPGEIELNIGKLITF